MDPSNPVDARAQVVDARAQVVAALRPLYNTEADADAFERRVLVINAVLLGHLVLCWLGWLPAWTFVLTIPPLFVRWLSTVHELSHLRGPTQVSVFVRLFLLLTGPFTSGFRELRIEHMLHHKHGLGPQDPTLYLVHGSTASGVWAALTAPEQLLFRSVKTNGTDRALLVDCAVRCGCFVLAALVFEDTFVWYWIVLRLSYAMAFFMFFRAIHRRGEQAGMFEARFPLGIEYLLVLWFGREAANAIFYHDSHHAHPLVSGRFLRQASRVLKT